MIREATEADRPSLAALLAGSPQAGRMVLAQDRTPDVFARRRPYAARVTLVHADPGGDLVATATCATKSVLVAGTEMTAGYVFDVAVVPQARRGGLAGRLLAGLEEWAHARGAALLYAHIMDGNTPSLGAFHAAGYRSARELVSRTYPLLRAVGAPPSGARPLEDWDAAARLLRGSLVAYDLVRPLDGSALRTLWNALPGWRPDDVWSTERALLGLWDYSLVARAVPIRLTRPLRVLSALASSASGVLPVPRLPKLGDPIRYGLLLGGAGDPDDLAALFAGTLTRARERRLDIVLFLHDSTLRPAWTTRAFSVTGAYHLVAKTLVAGPAERLGERPVWVDPVDL
jgi:GNAT superfamily N-acetyltransferase